MQLTFDHKDIVQAATIVAGLIRRSATTLPVLSNLLVEADGEHAVFTGTDLESLVRVHVPVRLTGGASARLTLPADKMAEIVGLLPAGAPVTIEDQGGQIRLLSQSNDYKLVTLPAEDYPNWSADAPTSRVRVGQKQLRRILDAVLYAVPSKDHRRVLLGALTEVKGGKVRLTATDGKKLSRMSADAVESDGKAEGRAVISGRLLGDVRKTLGDEGFVELELGDRQAALLVDNVEFRTNIIEGKYPDCDAVIPADFPHLVRLNRDLFQSAVRRAGVVSDDKSKSIILQFTQDRCEFTSMAADVGTFAGNASVEYTGNPIEVAYNYELMIQTLMSFSHPDILMNIKSEHAPTVFKCDAEAEHLCVLMPIKLADARPRPATAAAEE